MDTTSQGKYKFQYDSYSPDWLYSLQVFPTHPRCTREASASAQALGLVPLFQPVSSLQTGKRACAVLVRAPLTPSTQVLNMDWRVSLSSPSRRIY